MKTILSLFLAVFALNAAAQTADSAAVPYVFTVVNEIPLFPGCEGQEGSERIACFSENAEAFVLKLLHYPEQARKAGKEGVVYVSFIVNTLGKAEQVRLSRASATPGYGFEEEALRVVALLPGMIPAKQNNKSVDFAYTMAVPFKLENAAAGSPAK